MNSEATLAVDARLLHRTRQQGIGRITHELLRRFIPRHPELSWYFLLHHDLEDEFRYSSNVRPLKLFPPARHPFIEILWFDYYLPYLSKKYGVRCYYSPAGFISSRPSHFSQLMTIHDIAFHHYPESYKKSYAWYYNTFFSKHVHNADHIITVSHFTKSEITTIYKVPEEKITVIPNAASEHFKPVSEVEKEKIRKKWSGGKEYFLTVGTIQPRKNIARLLSAYDLFRSLTKSDVALLIVGKKGWKYNEVFETAKNLRYSQDIHFTGMVSDTDLRNLYAASVALCYVSIYEGFGLPVLEAMQCGTAVLTSNRTSLPEVAGDAALLVDPFDIEEIAAAMQTIYENADTRRELIRKGAEQCKKFSWDRSVQLFEQLLFQYI